ncbi:hypothetical protein NE237_031050 [Protea cynaroides]|uniref:AtPDCT1/2 transmembrane domain-containing protein n=1 Tax=Protea cynaroides TaxID=273540 RepID=A0A9Q0GX32_9MAGN|nr:hypothetical protein NE237_031050 [Protea cynaroides]
MFTCRGIMGYSTQFPLPEGFLGSKVDFPVGIGDSISGYASDAEEELAWLFDILNVLQCIRLLGTRGHYTIDLAVGVGAGYLFDSFAGKYQEKTKRRRSTATQVVFSTKIS